MLLPELETRALLGRSVMDLYGRSLGRVIGLERNPFGELEGVQVEGPGGQIVSAKARQLALTPKSITLTPDWKLESEDVISELSLLRKRISALESLKETKEIDGEIYAELVDSQKSGYVEKVKAAEALAASMKRRFAEITGNISSLTKYLVNAKLDHKSGELDDESLKLAQGSIEPTLRPLMAERTDLAGSLKSLEQILPTKVSLS
ncbi:MAG TPA: CdvA-like protein [Candidatus Bathyarchaeia archaeon]|nr:CdvA-like protein [Candidatus Bathyarchaeia archaeon]